MDDSRFSIVKPVDTAMMDKYQRYLMCRNERKVSHFKQHLIDDRIKNGNNLISTRKKKRGENIDNDSEINSIRRFNGTLLFGKRKIYGFGVLLALAFLKERLFRFTKRKELFTHTMELI